MAFPHEAVPDGAIFAPHHYTYGLLATLLVVMAVWDNYRCREPLLTAGATGAGLFGFLFVWPYYPTSGALLAVSGPIVAALAVVAGWAGTPIADVWDDYPLRYRLATLLGLLVALDDGVEHAFGVPTPLDMAWNTGLREQAVTVTAVLGALFVLVVLVEYLWRD